MPRRPLHSEHRDRIFRFLAEYPSGQTFHYSAIVAVTSGSESNVHYWLAKIAKGEVPGYRVKKVGRGTYMTLPIPQSYGSEPITPVTASHFELVGQTQEGMIIVRSENGYLYKIEAL